MNSKKGFGEVASMLIMFIAVIGVTIGVVVSFQNFVVNTQGSFEERQDLTSNKLKTSISITNTFYNQSSEQLYVYVKNIGEISLETSTFDAYVDKEYQNSFEIVSPTDFSEALSLLQVQGTLTVIINTTLSQGTHSTKIVTGYGVSDEESFNT